MPLLDGELQPIERSVDEPGLEEKLSDVILSICVARIGHQEYLYVLIAQAYNSKAQGIR